VIKAALVSPLDPSKMALDPSKMVDKQLGHPKLLINHFGWI